MSSLFMSNTERFNSQRLSRKQALPSRLWRQETPKRSASRSKVIENKNKIMKMEKTVKVKVSKKNNYVRKTQRSPHNTTQYIIDANSSSSDDTQSLYSEQDRFSFDFQHHMSAGSMMELMGNRFSEMYERMQVSEEKAVISNQEKSDEPVNSVINCLDTVSSLAKESQGESTGDVYNSYLEQADRADTDMQGLVRQLVDALRQKDEQINALKETGCNTEKY